MTRATLSRPASPGDSAELPRRAPQGTVGRWAAGAAVVLGLVLLCWQLVGIVGHVAGNYLLDVGVFRDAGRAIVEGGGLYGDDFDSRSGFAFIYPPLAAALFVPLTWFDESVMETLWTVTSLLAAWGVLAMVADRLRLARAPWVAVALLGFALCLEPVQTHLMYGQINVFLILLVTADLLGYTPRWLRGAGVGLAAGIKITPAAYALVFLVSRRWGDLARSAGAFLVTVVLGWVVRPAESLFYWTDEFFNGERGGAPEYEPNQALTGLMSRAGMDGDLAQTVMVPGLLVIAVLAGWGAYRLSAAGRPVSTLLLMVLAVSISAPVAVTHHWTGIIVAVGLLASLLVGWPGTVADRLTLVGVSVLTLVNLLFDNNLGDREPLYTRFEGNWLLSNLQGLAGILCFILLLVVAARCRPAPSRG
ncbi:glycosyltransferase 87 family protein [Corynebacterium kalidii]|uniref:Glycosyltransferase 87 family protein n=1 Tax=Corynebacterium kalidii TaxID=2931982 RepID=A0A9X1WG11_9CORY|nr:glycosyltransferase 87 family protein [Corynebacterium kalidii]MCJ7857483.1 glycosyltransferase 87 family protein [Corynebacterium kalidii]